MNKAFIDCSCFSLSLAENQARVKESNDLSDTLSPSKEKSSDDTTGKSLTEISVTSNQFELNLGNHGHFLKRMECIMRSQIQAQSRIVYFVAS